MASAISNHDNAQSELMLACSRKEWELADLLCQELIKYLEEGGNPGPKNTPEKALNFYRAVLKNIKEKLKCSTSS